MARRGMLRAGGERAVGPRPHAGGGGLRRGVLPVAMGHDHGDASAHAHVTSAGADRAKLGLALALILAFMAV